MGWLKGSFVVLLLSFSAFSAFGEENLSKGGSQCKGCLINGRCLQIGVRLEGQYCWVDGQLKPQKQDGGQCENAFECRNNHCTDGLCQEKAAKSLYDELKDWIFHIFRIVIVKRI